MQQPTLCPYPLLTPVEQGSQRRACGLGGLSPPPPRLRCGRSGLSSRRGHSGAGSSPAWPWGDKNAFRDATTS
jgi:hypothetical protein